MCAEQAVQNGAQGTRAKRLACGSGTEHGCSAFASLCQPTWGRTESRKSRRTRNRREADRLIKTEASLPEWKFERRWREPDKQRHQGFWSCGGSGIQADLESDEDRKQAPEVLREAPAVSATWTIPGPAMRSRRTPTNHSITWTCRAGLISTLSRNPTTIEMLVYRPCFLSGRST